MIACLLLFTDETTRPYTKTRPKRSNVQECRHPRRFQECHTLSSSLNVQLTDALRKYVDERASDKDVYATPSEHIRDLIRQDMQDRAIAVNVLEGLDDLKHGRFSAKSIRDLEDRD